MQQILKFPKLKTFAVGLMMFFICFSCMISPAFAEDKPTEPTKPEEQTSENKNQTVNDDTLVENEKTPEKTPTVDDIISANGTVVDYAKNKNREFYTIVTNDKTVFYLVVDHEKDNENVYFLRNINDADFKVKDNITNDEVADQGTVDPNNVDPNNIDGKENKPEVDSFYIMLGVVLLGVFGAGYYVKIVKPKKEKNKPQEVNEEDLYVNYDDDFDEDGEQNLVDEPENIEK